MIMLGFRETTITADDGALMHGFVHDGETLPVLLLHDLGADANYWTAFLEAALQREPKLAVAALDLRGHGGSELGTETSRKRFVKDLRKWVQQLEIDAPIVVGHGYGADVAMAADFVRSVVAVNPACGRGPAPVDDELPTPPELHGPISEDALRMCSVGAANAKQIKRSRRDAPLFLVLADPHDTQFPDLEQLREVATDEQIWNSGSRHLPLESPVGLATLVLGWIEEVE